MWRSQMVHHNIEVCKVQCNLVANYTLTFDDFVCFSEKKILQESVMGQFKQLQQGKYY